MAKAEITYNAGKTYRVKGIKFEQGKTKLVSDAATILKCQQTVGFCVRVLEPEKPVKKTKRPKVREVAETTTKKEKKSSKKSSF